MHEVTPPGMAYMQWCDQAVDCSKHMHQHMGVLRVRMKVIA